MSRKFSDNTEWQLNPKIFQNWIQKRGKPEIGLFASRLNHQTKPYIAWQPDPEALAVDAFTVNWGKWLTYIFPPLSLIQRFLTKIEADQAEGILIVPQWPTAVWFPQILRLRIQPPLTLPRGRHTLRLVHTDEIHPLHKNLQLFVVPFSEKPSKPKDFLEETVQFLLGKMEGMWF